MTTQKNLRPRFLQTLLLAALAFGSHQALADGDAGMRVVKDPVTGELRAPTPEEAKAFEATAKVRTARTAVADVATVRTVSSASGAVGVEVPESAYNYFVVTRAADGTLQAACSNGEDAATHAAHLQLLLKERANETQ